MNASQIAASFGLDLPIITATKEGAKAFQVLRSAASSWNAYQILYRSLPKKPFGLSASESYRLGTFWTQIGSAIGELSSGQEIPRAFMQFAERWPSEEALGSKYRYDVAVTLRFLKSGDVQTFYVHVDSDEPLSAARARDRAFGKLIGQFNLENYDIEEDDYEKYFDPSFDITGAFILSRR